MNYRDYLQQLIYKIINPVVHGSWQLSYLCMQVLPVVIRR